MALLKFEDLPSTATPLNAKNLNGNFNELNTKIESNTDEISKINLAIADIIQSGSNSNGEWIKYSNGTMICMARAYGKNNTYAEIVFPQSFIDIPFVTANIVEPASNYFGGVSTENVVGTGCRFYVYYVQFGTNAWGLGANKFNYIAIGKWK